MSQELSQLNPRETMRGLPSWIQPLLTMATAKPLQGQIPWKLTPTYHLTTATLTLITGVVFNIVSLHYYGVSLLLIIGWLLTVSGARKLQVMIVHQCAHQQFSAQKNFSQWLGETISIILTLQNFLSYKQEHNKDHHALNNLMTPQDPTFKFLQILGLLEDL